MTMMPPMAKTRSDFQEADIKDRNKNIIEA